MGWLHLPVKTAIHFWKFLNDGADRRRDKSSRWIYRLDQLGPVNQTDERKTKYTAPRIHIAAQR
jgi:hypothetical protein